jgi:probable HAF family extracellular repeat protein
METEAEKVSDRGQIVGDYTLVAGKFHGFSLAKGRFSTIDPPGSTFTLAFGINNRGEIVGGYNDAAGKAHGFLLAKGSFSTIDFPGARETGVGGINNHGEIVGTYFVGPPGPDTRFHGFLRR